MKILCSALVLWSAAFTAAAQTTPGTAVARVPERSGTNATSSHRDTGPEVEVLSSTMGVDFGPYLAAVSSTIRKNWSSRVPTRTLPAAKQRSKVTLEFAIGKSGELGSVDIDASSGDGDLDRAALNGIMASSPFAALPEQFPGGFIKLRVHFYYNPNPDAKAPAAAPKATVATSASQRM
jgi:TonB family protein